MRKRKYAQKVAFLKNVPKVGWFVVLFYGISTLFGSFTAESNFKQFGLVISIFFIFLFLWHINLYMLFHAEFIFIQMNSCISHNSV